MTENIDEARAQASYAPIDTCRAEYLLKTATKDLPSIQVGTINDFTDHPLSRGNKIQRIFAFTLTLGNGIDDPSLVPILRAAVYKWVSTEAYRPPILHDVHGDSIRLRIRAANGPSDFPIAIIASAGILPSLLGDTIFILDALHSALYDTFNDKLSATYRQASIDDFRRRWGEPYASANSTDKIQEKLKSTFDAKFRDGMDHHQSPSLSQTNRRGRSRGTVVRHPPGDRHSQR